MSCPNPLDAAALMDYWLAALSPAAEETLEEHLFACGECTARLQQIAALSTALRRLAREGDLLMVVSEMYLKRVAQEGKRVRQYAPPPGGSVECTVSLEDDFLIGRLSARLPAAQRIDLSLCDATGAERLRLPDIPYSPETGAVAFQQPISYAKAAPSETLVARLLTFDDAGAEHLLGEYTFHHTRTIPGPPGW